MKAEVNNSFEIGNLLLTTKTALFARMVDGAWRVHLNYHRINVRYNPATDNSDENIEMLKGQGLSVQSSRGLDFVAGVSSLLGAIGIVSATVDLVRSVLEILADTRGLVKKVLVWLKDELAKVILKGEEPTLQTRLEEAQFVMNLINDGGHFERRLPKWREKFKD